MSEFSVEIKQSNKWHLRGKYKGFALGENDSLSDIKVELKSALEEVMRKAREKEEQRKANETQVYICFLWPLTSIYTIEVVSTRRLATRSTGGPAKRSTGTRCP